MPPTEDGPAVEMVRIPPLDLEGRLTRPEPGAGIVVFAHGSGSSRLSPRNTFVADRLHGRGFATLLLDLLLACEATDRTLVFDIPLLADRLGLAMHWLGTRADLRDRRIGLFGASTGAAAALTAAAAALTAAAPNNGPAVGALVSRGGRPDLAATDLSRIVAPTLLIVGGRDSDVLKLNERALARLGGPRRLAVVPGATHLFEEPGALDRVVELAGDWFAEHLGAAAAPP